MTPSRAHGRCAIHDLACGPDGRCALCHRTARVPATRSAGTWIVVGAATLLLLLGGAVSVRGARLLGAAVRAQAVADQAVQAGAPQNPVRLYSTSWCPHCKRAKQWLASQHVAYAELDVEHDDWARREHRRLNPRGSVPTFDAYGEVVQGFSPELYQSALARGAAAAATAGTATTTDPAP